MEKIIELLNEIDRYVAMQEVLNPSVSKSSVGWHIEHSLITINAIITALSKSKSEEYKWQLNYKRLIVMTIGVIPRGRGRAPKIVQPSDFDTDSLKSHLDKTKTKILEMNSFHRNNFFFHPYFGNLNLKPTIRFLEIHTEHHLKIIRDILK